MNSHRSVPADDESAPAGLEAESRAYLGKAAQTPWHFSYTALLRYLSARYPGKDLRVLIEWVRAFVGFEYQWNIQLEILTESAPIAQLGKTQRLG